MGNSTVPRVERERIAREAWALGPAGTAVVAAKYDLAAGTIRRWQALLGLRDPVPGMHLTPEQINQARAAQREQPVALRQHVHPAYPDLRIPSMELGEVFDALAAMQEVVEKATPGQDEATVVIETTEPIVEVLTADWHLGAPGTDYRRFRDDLDFFCEADHLYATVVGDELENFVSFKSQKAMLGQLIEPTLQDRMLDLIYERLMKAGKIIGRTHGNHVQGFNERVYGGNDKWYVDAPYFPGSGKLWLQVGQEKYPHYLNHKFRGSSIYNAVHGAMRAARFEWDPALILCDAHTHDGLQYARFRDGDRIKYAIKLGTYKTRGDTYAQRFFGSSGFYGVAALVFWPDRQQFRLFEDVREAMLFRSALVGHSQAA